MWVVDPSYPEIIRLLNDSPVYVEEDDTYQPEVYVFPETADPEITWTSGDPKIASVDPQTGVVTPHAYGRVKITGVSNKNPKLSVAYKVVVLSEECWLLMPGHRTTIDEIDTIMWQIEKVRDCAYSNLDRLVAKGWISNSERNTRAGYIERAFDMYLFPWMTESKVLYWNAGYSVGGGKDFKPGVVYYGMAYTQSNRVNTPSSMINAGYYTDSGEGYYLLQTKKFSSRMYPGNDCSSFVSTAIWGMGNGRRSDTTKTIAVASYYRTLGSSYWADLRPGDLICLGGAHVVMFLYYANREHTQMVIIEQGGSGIDQYTNCVSANIRDVSYYRNKGYSIRRVNGLDMDYMK